MQYSDYNMSLATRTAVAVALMMIMLKGFLFMTFMGCTYKHVLEIKFN